MSDVARLLTIAERTVGDELADDHTTGASVLVVNDAYPFEELGGELSIVDEAGVSTQYTYLSVDDDLSAITLATTLTDDYLAGAQVRPFPEQTFKAATVRFGTDAPTDAVADHTLQGYEVLSEGARESDSIDVEVEWRRGDLTIVGVVNRPPALDITSLPPLPNVPTVAPDVAPTITAAPFAIGTVRVTIATVDPELSASYEVAASLTSPVAEDGSQTIGTASGTVYDIASLDGNQIPFDAPTYIKVRAVNAVGAGPWSSEVSGTPRQAEQDYISALVAYFGEIEAAQIKSGKIGAATIDLGDYIVLDGENSEITLYYDIEHTIPLIQLRRDGSVFRGAVIADDVSVLDGLILLGTDSQIASGAGLTMMNGVADPTTPPTLTAVTKNMTWPAVPATFSERGINWDQVDGCWIRLLVKTSGSKAGTSRVEKINATTGASISYVTLANVTGISEDNFTTIVRYGSSYYSAWRDTDETFPYWNGVARWAVSNGAYQAKASVGSDNDEGCGVGLDPSGNLVFAAPDPLFWTLYPINATTCAPGAAIGWLDFNLPTYVGVSELRFVGSVGSDYALSTTEYFGTAAIDSDILPATTIELSNVGVAAWRPSVGLFSTHGAGLLRQYSTSGAGQDYDYSGTSWVTYANTATGPLTTLDSPAASVAVQKGRYVQASLPPLPAGTTASDVFAGINATLPADAALDLRTETITSRSLTFDPGVAGNTSVHPPAARTFTGGSPGWLKSDVDNFKVDGAGGGKWKTYGLDTTADYWNWTSITSTTFSNYLGNAQNVGKYRVRNGMLWIRGVQSPATSTNATATMSTTQSADNLYATLPAGIVSRLGIYDPITISCQGSGKDTWGFRINSIGELYIYRYSGTASTSTYLSFTLGLPLEDV